MSVSIKNQIASISVIFLISLSISQAKPLKLEEVSTLLKTKGVMHFANAIQTKQFPPISIPSQRFCNAITDETEQKLVQQRRDFGLVLLKKINAIRMVSKKKEFGMIDDLFVVRRWCFKKASYENLILGWAAETKIIILLFQKMIDPKSKFVELKRRVDACFKNNPTSDFWLKMLAEEGEYLNLNQKSFNKKPEDEKIAEIYQTIYKCNSMGDQIPPKVDRLKKPEDLYFVLYSHYFPSYFTLSGMKLHVDRYTLASTLLIREHCNVLPKEKSEIEVLAEKYALKIMKPKKDRIGGRILPYKIWKALKRARAEQQ